MSIANTAHGKHTHAHHFESAEHEYSSSKQGIWLFLVTEILMFGGLFVAYSIYHGMYPEVFKAGSKFVDWRLGATNTVVLITSSLTMALGIYYIQKNNMRLAAINLFLTIICGALFMIIKYIEYSHKIHEGMLPSKYFSYTGDMVTNGQLYFGFYYVMTGLHGIHVLVGMGLIAWCLIRTLRGDFNPRYYTAVEGVGLFWHLVDLIWIYLFPLFYLVG
ncbi:MAG: cytochrome c oxidase subunit 3 family protein [Bdellovibrionales bacterium]